MLTVAQLADVIRPPEADKAAVIERLRPWTTLGLLETLGSRNPGTGQVRRYPESAVYPAAVLNSLADLGLHIGKERYLTLVLVVTEQARAEWAKKKRPNNLVMEIADFGVAHPDDPKDVMRAVFLHRGTKRGHIGNLMHPRAESSLFINVSRLFKRVDDQMAAKAEAERRAG